MISFKRQYQNYLKLISVAIVSIFTYLMVRSVYPLLPGPLEEDFNICNFNDINTWGGEKAKVYSLTHQKENFSQFELTFLDPPPHGIMFWCENFIPDKVLLKAKTINAILEVNQRVDVSVSFYRKSGGGPTWEIISADMDKPINISFPLDRQSDRKLNWLVGNFGQTVFLITGYDYKRPVRVKIYRTYLR